MENDVDKFAKEPAEGDRDVIDHELKRRQEKQTVDKPPRPDTAEEKSKD